MKVIKKWNDIQFWNKIFFSSNWNIKKDTINLFANKGSSIKKTSSQAFIIDYPGEYEKYNIYIQVITWNTDRLNFFIQDYDNKENFAFIQDPSILENLELSRYPNKWYYLDEIVFNQIERLGFEWETIKIDL